MNGTEDRDPQVPNIVMKDSVSVGGDGYYVELGDQRFTQHQWELIQLYAEGNLRARDFQSALDYHDTAQAERTRQVELGYDAKHDDTHGLDHLLVLAQQYHLNNEQRQVAGLLQAAREYLTRNRQEDRALQLDSFFQPDEYVGSLSRTVFTALGEISACWSNLEGAGTFESTRARAIGERLLDSLREYGIVTGGHKAQLQNAEFHAAFGIATPSSPQAIPAEDVPVVIELIREEFIDELIPALGFKVTFTNDGHFDTIERVAEPNVLEIYDAFIDILYVTYGGMNRAGMQAEPGYDEVQGSNMSKLGEDGKPIIAGENDPDGIFPGRVKKGPNYYKPNLTRVLREQGWQG